MKKLKFKLSLHFVYFDYCNNLKNSQFFFVPENTVKIILDATELHIHLGTHFYVSEPCYILWSDKISLKNRTEENYQILKLVRIQGLSLFWDS